ncbi:hypothetical protein Tco_1545134 [Tanacetum coccineum]
MDIPDQTAVNKRKLKIVSSSIHADDVDHEKGPVKPKAVPLKPKPAVKPKAAPLKPKPAVKQSVGKRNRYVDDVVSEHSMNQLMSLCWRRVLYV